MANGNSNAVLRRKAVAAREVYQARAMSPVKALRLALSKSADELLDLSLVVRSAEYEFVTVEQMLEMLSDEQLLILLDGADNSSGVLGFDLSTTAALVEQSTMGRVSPLEPDPRPTTATDAALVAPVIDDVLLRLAMMLEGERDMHWVPGYSFGVRIENKRLLALALEAPDFHVFRLNLDLGGVKQGNMVLALQDRAKLSDLELDLRDGTASKANLGDAVMGAPASIDAILHRVSLPLSEISRLKVGDLIPVPREALSETRLEATGRGTCLGHVRLGQVNGFRAVRLTMEELAEARNMVGGRMDESFGSTDQDGSMEGFQQDEGGYPDLPGLPPLAPAMEDSGFPDLPALDDGDLPDLPPLGGDASSFDDDLPPLGDLAPMGDLPPLEDLPDLSDLPELGGDDDGFPSMSMADLPDLPPLDD